MCTVTVVRDRQTARLACNRDEQRSRPTALLPRVHPFGPRQAVLPVDPASGGTWIAANDAGLALRILNVSSRDAGETIAAPRSRGTIIPELLPCDTLATAVTRGLRLDARLFAPFRLVLVDDREVAELRSDGDRVGLVRHAPLDEPLLFTSSGLGDHRVERPRQRLFAELVGRPDDGPAGQDAFHRHHWPDRPHLSVCMHRADARTVSHTAITLGPNAVQLVYHPDAPDVPAAPSVLELQRTRGGAS